MLLALFGYLSAIGTLFSSIFASWALFVFRMSPNASASDQSIAPRGYVKTVFRSIFLNCPARAIVENKLRSILNGINRSLTLTLTTFCQVFKCLHFWLRQWVKKVKFRVCWTSSVNEFRDFPLILLPLLWTGCPLYQLLLLIQLTSW